MNSLPVILSYFMHGGENVSFCHHIIINTTFNGSISKWKKNDTLLRYMYQESALSMIISLKHFLFSAE